MLPEVQEKHRWCSETQREKAAFDATYANEPSLICLQIANYFLQLTDLSGSDTGRMCCSVSPPSLCQHRKHTPMLYSCHLRTAAVRGVCVGGVKTPKQTNSDIIRFLRYT